MITPGLRLSGEKQEGQRKLKIVGCPVLLKIKVPNGRMEGKEGGEGKNDTDK